MVLFTTLKLLLTGLNYIFHFLLLFKIDQDLIIGNDSSNYLTNGKPEEDCLGLLAEVTVCINNNSGQT